MVTDSIETHLGGYSRLRSTDTPQASSTIKSRRRTSRSCPAHGGANSEATAAAALRQACIPQVTQDVSHSLRVASRANRSIPQSGRSGGRVSSLPRLKSSHAPPQMDVHGVANATSVRYWDEFAARWDDEIQDTLMEDCDRVITKALDDFVEGTNLALDLGCGVGKYLAAMATRAVHVVGLDISPRCIEVAQQLCARRRLRNCDLFVADIGIGPMKEQLSIELKPAEAVVCTNVLISPDAATRQNIMKNAYCSLAAPTLEEDETARHAGGVLILVVPSVESAVQETECHRMWVRQRRQQQLRRLPTEKAEATCEADEVRGIFRREGTRTKHFSEEELSMMLEGSGFRVLRLERVHYNVRWGMAFAGVSDSRPFDWLAVARRVSCEPDMPA